MVTMLRPTRAAFRFSGADAHKLLFDVVTGRLVPEAGMAVWWALLSPQGKIQAEGLAGWQDDAYWLDVDHSVADAFLKRMRMYRLRAAVEIEDLRATHRVGFAQDMEPPGVTHTDRMGPIDLGWRTVAAISDTQDWAEASALYAEERVAAGIAELGPDFAPDAAFPHDIGMDLLDGVDFKKGCYVGQEVVSRMQHRGTARRRPVIVSDIPDGAGAGAPVMLGEREAGVLGAVSGGMAVAILRLDRITDPSAATVEGRPVHLALPPWASYAFGESGDPE